VQDIRYFILLRERE